MGKLNKIFSIRVHNITKSCFLMRQYPNGVWSFPTIVIPGDAEPLDFLDELLEQVDGEFELTSALSMLEFTKKDKEGNGYQVIIYHIGWHGKVHPNLPRKKPGPYKSGQWMQIEALKNRGDLDTATAVFMQTLAKDPSLR